MDDEEQSISSQLSNMSVQAPSNTPEIIVMTPDVGYYATSTPNDTNESPMQEGTPESSIRYNDTVSIKSEKPDYVDTQTTSVFKDESQQTFDEKDTDFVLPPDNQELGNFLDNEKRQSKKLIKKIELRTSDMINTYCTECKTTSNKYMDKKCCFCNSKLLYQCHNCKAIFNKLVSVENHVKTECLKSSIFYCSECDFSSPVKLQLLKHIQENHLPVFDSVNIFNCSKCRKNFHAKSNLTAHEKICGLEPNLMCKWCPYKTASNGALATHVRMKHPEHKPVNEHACPDCGKTYKKQSTLRQHIKTACGKTALYKCHHCEYENNRRYKMEDHMKKVHPEIYERKYATLCRRIGSHKSSAVTTNAANTSNRSVSLDKKRDLQKIIKDAVEQAVNKYFDTNMDVA